MGSWSNELYFKASYDKFKEQEVYQRDYLVDLLSKKTDLLESLVKVNLSLTEKANYFDDVTFSLPTLMQSRQLSLPLYKLVNEESSDFAKFSNILKAVQLAYDSVKNITDFSAFLSSPTSAEEPEIGPALNGTIQK